MSRRALRRWLLCAALVIAGAARAAPMVIDLPGERAFPESISAASDGTLYVSSFASGGVTRIRPEATEGEVFIAPGAFGTRSTFGVLVDDSANMLWVCSNDASTLGAPGPVKIEGSFLFGFDLAAGAPRLSARVPGERTLCSDMAIGPDRAVYVANMFAPEILRLDPAKGRLEVWLHDPVFEPPQNGGGLDAIAFGAGGALYVATFTSGELFRIEIADGRPGRVTRLETSRPLVNPASLRPLGDDRFLMAEGGGSLDRVTIIGDRAEIETIADGYLGPTGATRVGDTAFVTEGQIARLAYPQSGEAPRLPFRVYAVPLVRPRAD